MKNKTCQERLFVQTTSQTSSSYIKETFHLMSVTVCYLGIKVGLNTHTMHVDMTGEDAEEEGMVCGGKVKVLLEEV